MTTTIEISGNTADGSAIVDAVDGRGETIRLAREGRIVADVRPPAKQGATLAELVSAIQNGPRLGPEEAASFATDVEAAREDSAI